MRSIPLRFFRGKKAPEALGRLFALDRFGDVDPGHPIIPVPVMEESGVGAEAEDTGVARRVRQQYCPANFPL